MLAASVRETRSVGRPGVPQAQDERCWLPLFEKPVPWGGRAFHTLRMNGAGYLRSRISFSGQAELSTDSGRTALATSVRDTRSAGRPGFPQAQDERLRLPPFVVSLSNHEMTPSTDRYTFQSSDRWWCTDARILFSAYLERLFH